MVDNCFSGLDTLNKVGTSSHFNRFLVSLFVNGLFQNVLNSIDSCLSGTTESCSVGLVSLCSEHNRQLFVRSNGVLLSSSCLLMF